MHVPIIVQLEGHGSGLRIFIFDINNLRNWDREKHFFDIDQVYVCVFQKARVFFIVRRERKLLVNRFIELGR